MWIFLETHNPADDSCWGALLPDSPRWTRLNYSREHKAKIVGLDHHCAWLNVSIGRSNYLPFYILVVAGMVQFLMQFAVGLLILTLYSREAARAFGAYTAVFDVLLAVSELLSCYIGVSYALCSPVRVSARPPLPANNTGSRLRDGPRQATDRSDAASGSLHAFRRAPILLQSDGVPKQQPGP